METPKEMYSAEHRDQYLRYGNLTKLLKRYSFEGKMSVATRHSCAAAFFYTQKWDEKYTGVLPWCLETFVMLSMEATEYSNNNFQGKNGKKFLKMANAILNESSLLSESASGKFTFADVFFPSMCLNQFPIQEMPWIKRYRYWRVFSDNTEPVRLKEIFLSKMGAEYEDFLLLGIILETLVFVIEKENLSPHILQPILRYLIFERFTKAAKQLMISREDYVRLQKKFVADSEDPRKYLYSLSPSYQYALVEYENHVYLPLPHLLNQNITTSLFYRITDCDNNLRSAIGKNVWEKYLFKIIRDTGIYQDVCREISYTYKGSDSLSPDVMARQENDILFVDSKSTVPSIGVRLQDEAAYEKNIKQVSESIFKLYNQIHRFSNYNPFEGVDPSVHDSHWGIVVVLEDSYIRRIHYFENACRLLNIEKNTSEWNWLIKHIKVISLYEIERLCLTGCSIVEACKESFTDDPFNFTFSGFPSDSPAIENSDFLKFKRMFVEKTSRIVKDIRDSGLLM